MSYAVREVFLTLQGEGARAGTKAVFVRMAGCNLWTGREQDRTKGSGPCAAWCDTDFFKGTKMTATAIADEAARLWPGGGERWIVVTGGEPMLQVDEQLVQALHAVGFMVAVETNGTVNQDRLSLLDWVCLSPKHGTAWHPALVHADEVKVVVPGAGLGDPGWSAADLEQLAAIAPDSALLYAQPEDEGAGPLGPPSQLALAHVLAHPRWRLSLQTHKLLGLR